MSLFVNTSAASIHTLGIVGAPPESIFWNAVSDPRTGHDEERALDVRRGNSSTVNAHIRTACGSGPKHDSRVAIGIAEDAVLMAMRYVAIREYGALMLPPPRVGGP